MIISAKPTYRFLKWKKNVTFSSLWYFLNIKDRKFQTVLNPLKPFIQSLQRIHVKFLNTRIFGYTTKWSLQITHFNKRPYCQRGMVIMHHVIGKLFVQKFMHNYHRPTVENRNCRKGQSSMINAFLSLP